LTSLALGLLAAKVITASNGYTLEFRKLPEDRLKGAGLCGTCASLTGQALNILVRRPFELNLDPGVLDESPFVPVQLNYVLNVGVVGGCGKVPPRSQ